MTTTYPTDYNERLKEYNKQVLELAEQRRKFYDDNPVFPFKTMYINVIALPQKLSIVEVR